MKSPELLRAFAERAGSTASPENWRSPLSAVRRLPDRPEHILSGDGLRQHDWTSACAADLVKSDAEATDEIPYLDEGGVLARQSGPVDITGQMASLMKTYVCGEPPHAHPLHYDLMLLPQGSTEIGAEDPGGHDA